MTRISFEITGDAKQAMTLVQQHVPGATNIQANNPDGSITTVDGTNTATAPSQPNPATQSAEQQTAQIRQAAQEQAGKSAPSAPRTGR